MFPKKSPSLMYENGLILILQFVSWILEFTLKGQFYIKKKIINGTWLNEFCSSFLLRRKIEKMFPIIP